MPELTATTTAGVGEDAAAVFALHGEIDLRTAEAIRSACTMAQSSGYDRLVLDLSDVTFMDSQGVKALVVAASSLAATGGGLRVRNPSPCVRDVLALTGVDTVVAVDG